jgi:histidine triad (HIT) family protein
MAFLDIRPLSKGHTLVVPKMEVDRLFDLPEDEFLALWAFAHKVAKAIDATIPCNRVGVAVLGFEVPHAHIHLVPLRTEEELNFAHPKLQLAPEVMEEIAALIAHEVSEDILH